MNKKTMQIVIVIACLIVAVVVLAMTMRGGGGQGATPEAVTGEDGQPMLAPSTGTE